jgi:lysyl-tRNA synthetase class 2
VGGFDRVFEMGRFRNEGLSRKHNPEFTTIEFYWAYATYQELMKFTEGLLAMLALDVTGSTKLTYQGQAIDFTPPYPRISMVEHTAHKLGLEASAALAGLGLKAAIEKAAQDEKDKDLRAILDHAAGLATPGEMIAGRSRPWASRRCPRTSRPSSPTSPSRSRRWPASATATRG